MSKFNPETKKKRLEHIYSCLYTRIKECFSAPVTKASNEKLNALCKYIYKENWADSKIENYFEFSFAIQQRIKDDYKKSSLPYFIAILSSFHNCKAYLDYLKCQQAINTSTDIEQEDEYIEYKGRKYILVSSKRYENVEIYFHFDTKTKRCRFVVKDYSAFIPVLKFLSVYNEIYPDNEIDRNYLIKLLRKRGKI